MYPFCHCLTGVYVLYLCHRILGGGKESCFVPARPSKLTQHFVPELILLHKLLIQLLPMGGNQMVGVWAGCAATRIFLPVIGKGSLCQMGVLTPPRLQSSSRANYQAACESEREKKPIHPTRNPSPYGYLNFS